MAVLIFDPFYSLNSLHDLNNELHRSGTLRHLAAFYLLRVRLLWRQCAWLLVQSVDYGPVTGDLLGHVLVFLHQSLSRELVMADVDAGDDPQHVQHPRVDVIGVSLQRQTDKFYTTQHNWTIKTVQSFFSFLLQVSAFSLPQRFILPTAAYV